MEQFRGEKRLASEKESEKILDIIKRDIIFDGVELHMKILATKNAKNLLHKLKGREKLKECSKDEDDEYDKLAWERAIILEIELEEKQKEWEESVADFLREKALCELGKGKEIDRETSLILDRKIELTSIKFKDRKHIFALPPSAKDSELYEMSFRGLEKRQGENQWMRFAKIYPQMKKKNILNRTKII